MATTGSTGWLSAPSEYDPYGGPDPQRRRDVLQALSHLGDNYVSSPKLSRSHKTDLPYTNRQIGLELRRLAEYGHLEKWGGGETKTYRVWDLPSFTPVGKPPLVKRVLYCLYWRKGLSLKEVGEHLRYSAANIRRLMEKFGIPRRDNATGGKRQCPAAIPKGYLDPEERERRMNAEGSINDVYDPTGGATPQRRVDVLEALRERDVEYVSCRDLDLPYPATAISLELRELRKHGFLERYSGQSPTRYRIHSLPRITKSERRKAFVWEFRDEDCPTIPDASKQTPAPDDVTDEDEHSECVSDGGSKYTIATPAYKDKDELYDLYWGENLTLKEIGERLDTRWQSVLDYMRKFGIPRRGSGAKAWDGESIPPGFELE